MHGRCRASKGSRRLPCLRDSPTVVFDRVPDPSSPPPSPTGGDGADVLTATKLVGLSAAKLPVGVDFLGRPFSEPLLIRIATAHETATKHRTPPRGYDPVAGEP